MSHSGANAVKGFNEGREREDYTGPVRQAGYISTATSLVRAVTSAGSELGRRCWGSAPAPRPFRVCNHDRSRRSGVTAGTLRELIGKAMDAVLVTGLVSLVLDEDGTLVDTEDFFRHLEDDTRLMVLEKGQSWRSTHRGTVSYALTQKPKNSKDIARITLDIYKRNPRDLFGSLNVRATFYGLYSMTFDIKGLGPKKVIRELLRVMASMLHGVGHILVSAASFMRRIVEGGDTAMGSFEWPARP
ncbi:cell death activator CIDE-B [Leucoraja erinacea]|uniref:cell death activator CIDE-B n=1 Tax=Leucoraja erinaceus TaxID=7782 RepID=UPI0024552771|nr:cell death activator CIDE-B [Leucoraja erinacea]